MSVQYTFESRLYRKRREAVGGGGGGGCVCGKGWGGGGVSLERETRMKNSFYQTFFFLNISSVLSSV